MNKLTSKAGILWKNEVKKWKVIDCSNYSIVVNTPLPSLGFLSKIWDWKMIICYANIMKWYTFSTYTERASLRIQPLPHCDNMLLKAFWMADPLIWLAVFDYRSITITQVAGWIQLYMSSVWEKLCYNLALCKYNFIDRLTNKWIVKSILKQ